jgi:hypothetical protein
MHLSPEIAFDLLEGHLLPDEAAFWKQHLEICSDCARHLEEWETLGTVLRRSHLKSASDEDLRKAVNIFPDSPEQKGSTMRSVLASIIFDSFAEPALAGVRGGAAAARQVVMHAEEFDIHVKIWGDSDQKQMLGQLLPRSGKNFVNTARFHLLRNGERIETTAVDDMGEFHFINVPEGDLSDLSLQIDLPNLTVIGALNVKERS